MFCSKCAQELPENSLACFRCGVQFAPHILAVKEDKQKTKQPSPIIIQQSSNAGAVILLLILLALGVGAFFIYQKRQADKTYFSISSDGIKLNLPSSESSTPSNQSSRSTNSYYSQPQKEQQRQTSISSNDTICEINSTTTKVNGHEHCDTENCDDPSTSTYTLDTGDAVALTGRTFASGLSNVGNWVEIKTEDGIKLFVAESKLSCEN